MKRAFWTIMSSSMAAIAIASGTLTAHAQPTSISQPESVSSVAQDQYCVILVDKPEDANVPSDELFSACSTTSIEDAEGQMRAAEAISRASNRGAAAQAAAIPIMRWSENLNNSSPYTVIYGNAGPCDSVGYNLGTGTYWNTRITSMQGYNNCNFVRMYQLNGNVVQTRQLPLGYVGDAFNDNMRSMVTHS